MDARIIYGIVVLVVLLVVCFIHWRIADGGDLGEFLVDEFGWVTALVILLLGGVGYGVAFWKWDLKIVLSVAIPIVFLFIASFIHWRIADCVDFEDFFIDEYGWVTVLAVCIAAGIAVGCIFWIWWAVLVIAVGVSLLASAGFFIYKKNEIAEEENSLERIQDDMKVIKRSYKCPNCGAQISEDSAAHERRALRFYCEHCDTRFTERELKEGKCSDAVINEQKNDDRNSDDIDLTDFEEEYFNACYRLRFRPYNFHSKNQLERRYVAIQNEIDWNDFSYDDAEDEYESQQMLESAYEFFQEESETIEDYLNEQNEKTIKDRYDYYLKEDEEQDSEYWDDEEE